MSPLLGVTWRQYKGQPTQSEIVRAAEVVSRNYGDLPGGGVLEVVFLARIKAYRRRRRHSATRLSAFVGRRVEITTPYGNVVGMLQSVSPGYVTVTNEDGTHFVRVASVCWIRPEETTPLA